MSRSRAVRSVPLALVLAMALAACGSAPEEASLSAAAGATSAPDDAATTAASSAPATSDAAVAPDLALADLDGTWEVVPGDAATIDQGTFVGYRVDEELARVGSTTAVGRTPAVTGELVLDGGTLTTVDVTADVTQLASDSGNRDNAIRGNGLETNDFPEATFVLTEPVELPGEAASGEPVTVTAVGELTLHGVTNPVEFELDAQLVESDLIVAAAQIDIVMSDYDVTPPMLGPVLSISDEGVAELQLRFAR